MAREETKTSLSGNVLQMKFMKRSAIRIEKEKSEEEKRQVIDDEHWVLDLPRTEKTESKYIREASYQRCNGLLYGRMSFQGLNLEVEKLMKINNDQIKLEEAERKEQEISVDDKEMAERYDALVGTISKKFTKKRDQRTIDKDNTYDDVVRKKTKKQFMKPSDV